MFPLVIVVAAIDYGKPHVNCTSIIIPILRGELFCPSDMVNNINKGKPRNEKHMNRNNEVIPRDQSKKRTRRSYRNKSNLNPDSGVRPKKKKKRQIENVKEKFRKSKEWKDFRSQMAKLFNHRDYITGKRLVKGFNVHHLKTE